MDRRGKPVPHELAKILRRIVRVDIADHRAFPSSWRQFSGKQGKACGGFPQSRAGRPAICYHSRLRRRAGGTRRSVDMPNLPDLRDDREFSLGVFSPDLQEPPVGKPRGRRLLVFLCVCLPVLVLGLAYTVMQPAEYQATARLEITPASATPTPVDDTPGAKTGAETGGGTARGPRS